MAFRLLAAAFMAALGATLGQMLARVAVVPALASHVQENDMFLLHQVALGVVGGLALQLVLLRSRASHARPAGPRTGLLWGLAGFLTFILAPWVADPAVPPGRVPGLDDPGLALWLFAIVAAGGGLALLWRPGRQVSLGRLAGLVLLALPLLAGGLAAGAGGDGLATPGYGLLAESGPELGAWQGLVLNLMFWLLLGYFSTLAARRVVQPAGPETGASGPAPDRPPEG